jgi:hypothetical protein
MLRTIRFIVAIVLAIASQVYAQPAPTPAPTVLAIDINKGTFSWEWSGTADPEIAFRVTCLDANNVASTKDVPSSQLSVPVNQVVTAPSRSDAIAECGVRDGVGVPSRIETA